MAVRGRAQQLETRLAEPLEAVRRSARLEGAAADDLRAAARHDLGRAFDLVAALHAARSRHYHDAVGADLDRGPPVAPDLDHCSTWAERAAGQLIRRDDAVRLLDPLHHFETGDVELFLAAHAAEDRVHHASGAVNVKAQLDQPVNDRLNLRLDRTFLHHY